MNRLDGFLSNLPCYQKDSFSNMSPHHNSNHKRPVTYYATHEDSKSTIPTQVIQTDKESILIRYFEKLKKKQQTASTSTATKRPYSSIEQTQQQQQQEQPSKIPRK